MNTIIDAMGALKNLQGFMSNDQLKAVSYCLRREERQFFIDKMVELSERISTMPKTYEQDGLGMKAIAYLHYFKGGADWYITEKDMESEQLQAFGQASRGYGPKLGYISIVELVAADAELDFHFDPQTLALINNPRGGA